MSDIFPEQTLASSQSSLFTGLFPIRDLNFRVRMRQLVGQLEAKLLILQSCTHTYLVY